MFCLRSIIVQDFAILGRRSLCQLWLNPWKRWRRLEILWHVPNLAPIRSCERRVASSRGGKARSFIASVPPRRMCSALFSWRDHLAPSVLVPLPAHGNQGCTSVQGKRRSYRSLQTTSFLGQDVFLALTKNHNSHHFFLNALLTWWCFFILWNRHDHL